MGHRRDQIYITNGSRAGRGADGGADPDRGKGWISNFIVPQGTPGFRVARRYDKNTGRPSDTVELVFKNCRVPADHMVGERGRGFQNFLHAPMAGGSASAPCRWASPRPAWSAPSPHANQRHQFGGAHRAFQAINTTWYADPNAPRMVTKPAWLRDQGRPHHKEASMASCSPRNWRSRPPWRPCRSTAATATCVSTRPGTLPPRRQVDDDRRGEPRRSSGSRSSPWEPWPRAAAPVRGELAPRPRARRRVGMVVNPARRRRAAGAGPDLVRTHRKFERRARAPACSPCCPTTASHCSFAELHEEATRFANVLYAPGGCGPGDRGTLMANGRSFW